MLSCRLIYTNAHLKPCLFRWQQLMLLLQCSYLLYCVYKLILSWLKCMLYINASKASYQTIESHTHTGIHYINTDVQLPITRVTVGLWLNDNFHDYRNDRDGKIQPDGRACTMPVSLPLRWTTGKRRTTNPPLNLPGVMGSIVSQQSQVHQLTENGNLDSPLTGLYTVHQPTLTWWL